MEITTENRKLFATYLTRALALGVLPSKELIYRAWIHFEWDPVRDLWKGLPSGLAIIAVFSDPELALVRFYKSLVSCGYSYEAGAEKVTQIPAALLTQANRVFGRGQFTIDQIIEILNNDQALEQESVGPRIIDKMADPGC